MTGVMFTSPDGNDIDLNGTNISIAGLTGGADDTSSDLIMVWDAELNGYTTYYYYYEDGAAPEDVRWWDAGGESEPIFSSGTAFWYKAKEGGSRSITISGQVENDADITIELVGGKLNMCINPYPSDIDLNSSSVTIENLSGGADDTSSDLVMVWDAELNGYTTYYYYYEDGAAPEDVRWWDAGGESEPVITIGAGFWYKAKSGEGKKIVFKRPF